jgi:hypothetical protein
MLFYMNLFGWRGGKFLEHFKGGASYNSLGTPRTVLWRIFRPNSDEVTGRIGAL